MITSRRHRFLLAGFAAAPLLMFAAPAPPNHDEDKVPTYVLPDPLRLGGGAAVASEAGWRAQRRPELLAQFSELVYGRTPIGRPAGMHARVTALDRGALDGTAVRTEISIWLASGDSGPHFRLLLYRPAAATRPVPVFLGLNFHGNHTVHADPGIALPEGWVPNQERFGVIDHRATAQMRGCEAAQWQVETLLARGYALATVYSGDLCPDQPEGLAVSAAEITGGEAGTESRAADAWGAIGVWAWGLSRALDALAEDPNIDTRRVALIGHSRLGKAALWAGAQDERFALVISNESGCGGAALNKRVFGETVAAINSRFPHWFARNFRRFNDREDELPIDQHELLALIAPRPLYVASAEEDRWADPRGEFLAARAADPVYALFGKTGIGIDTMPPVGQPVGETVRYHLRPGPHDITAYDWAQYLDFADRWLGGN